MAKGHYMVTAYVGEGDWELGARELEAIHEVNPLRVVSVSVQCLGGDDVANNWAILLVDTLKASVHEPSVRLP